MINVIIHRPEHNPRRRQVVLARTAQRRVQARRRRRYLSCSEHRAERLQQWLRGVGEDDVLSGGAGVGGVGGEGAQGGDEGGEEGGGVECRHASIVSLALGWRRCGPRDVELRRAA